MTRCAHGTPWRGLNGPCIACAKPAGASLEFIKAPRRWRRLCRSRRRSIRRRLMESGGTPSKRLPTRCLTRFWSVSVLGQRSLGRIMWLPGSKPARAHRARSGRPGLQVLMRCLLPTAPILPPNVERLMTDQEYYVTENLLALRNTRIGNLMGSAGQSPCRRAWQVLRGDVAGERAAIGGAAVAARRQRWKRCLGIPSRSEGASPLTCALRKFSPGISRDCEA